MPGIMKKSMLHLKVWKQLLYDIWKVLTFTKNCAYLGVIFVMVNLACRVGCGPQDSVPLDQSASAEYSPRSSEQGQASELYPSHQQPVSKKHIIFTIFLHILNW